MSKRCKMNLHHVITVYNDMFNYIDSVMPALARKNTQWKKATYFMVNFARQKLSKYYTEVTPMTSMLLMSAHILDPVQRYNNLGSGTKQCIFILRMKLPTLPNTRRHFCSIWIIKTVPNLDECPSLNPKMFRDAISSSLQRLLHLLNCLLTNMNCTVMMKYT